MQVDFARIGVGHKACCGSPLRPDNIGDKVQLRNLLALSYRNTWDRWSFESICSTEQRFDGTMKIDLRSHVKKHVGLRYIGNTRTCLLKKATQRDRTRKRATGQLGYLEYDRDSSGNFWSRRGCTTLKNNGNRVIAPNGNASAPLRGNGYTNIVLQ